MWKVHKKDDRLLFSLNAFKKLIHFSRKEKYKFKIIKKIQKFWGFLGRTLWLLQEAAYMNNILLTCSQIFAYHTILWEENDCPLVSWMLTANECRTAWRRLTGIETPMSGMNARATNHCTNRDGKKGTKIVYPQSSLFSHSFSLLFWWWMSWKENREVHWAMWISEITKCFKSDPFFIKLLSIHSLFSVFSLSDVEFLFTGIWI